MSAASEYRSNACVGTRDYAAGGCIDVHSAQVDEEPYLSAEAFCERVAGRRFLTELLEPMLLISSEGYGHLIEDECLTEASRPNLLRRCCCD